MVIVPIRRDLDDPTVPIWPDDLDLRQWFPFGTDRFRLSSFPVDPMHSLRNHYTAFTSMDPERSAPNQCLSARWGVDVTGNVLVVRHGRGNLMRVTNIQSVEHQLIDFLIVRFVKTC